MPAIDISIPVEPLGLAHLARYTAAWLVLGLPVLIFLPWLLVPLVVAGGLVLSALAAGPLAVLAPVLFLVSACALGCALLRPREEGLETQLLATLLGGSLFVFAAEPASRRCRARYRARVLIATFF